MFSFLGNNKNSELDTLASTSTAKPGSVADLTESPLSEVSAIKPGQETSCMNFLVTSKLGWIAWKDTEASLYGIFERSFGSVRCELKLSEDFKEMAMEVEIPNEFVDKFNKFFNNKALTMEVDKLHGIEPSLARYSDAKFSGLKKTLGQTASDLKLTSSMEVLARRLDALENCGTLRRKEIDAITSLAENLNKDMNGRFDSLKSLIQSITHEKCLSKLEIVEKSILAVVREDLAFLGTEPFQLSEGSSIRNKLEDTLKNIYSPTQSSFALAHVPGFSPTRSMGKLNSVESSPNGKPSRVSSVSNMKSNRGLSSSPLAGKMVSTDEPDPEELESNANENQNESKALSINIPKEKSSISELTKSMSVLNNPTNPNEYAAQLSLIQEQLHFLQMQQSNYALQLVEHSREASAMSNTPRQTIASPTVDELLSFEEPASSVFVIDDEDHTPTSSTMS